MWHTSENIETFTGSIALVIAYGVNEMLEILEDCYDSLESGFDLNDDEHCFGHKAFARLTLEQKIWTLHKVAFGLLDQKIPVVRLTAYLEATVATIFRQVEDLVTIEIDVVRVDNDKQDIWYAVRRAILAVHEKEGWNSPDHISDDEPLKVDCEDIEEWKIAIGQIESSILWDMDYDLTPIDKHPSLDAAWRSQFSIDDDYFTAIPKDPKPAEAGKLLRKTSKLCDRVIKREEKKLSKGQ